MAEGRQDSHPDGRRGLPAHQGGSSGQGWKSALDHSLEKRKEKNDFLPGVPAIVDAMRGRDRLPGLRQGKFHAKAYITHARQEVVGSRPRRLLQLHLPGITENIELNVQITAAGQRSPGVVREHWNDAEDVTPEILRVIERHIREYTPFEVYAKSLQEFFRATR